MIISGAIFGMIFEEEMNEKSHLGKFFFAALSGIFLYISLTSFFPVLQALIDQAGKCGPVTISKMMVQHNIYL